MVLVRVVQTWGSSPRPVGSSMIINEDGAMIGSVSGGCVEGDVVKQAMHILEGRKADRVSYGVSDEDAWNVGLSCGGRLTVELTTIDDSIVWKTLFNTLNNNRFAVLISSVNEEEKHTLITENGLVGDEIPEQVRRTALAAYKSRKHDEVTVGDKQYFIHHFPPKSLLLIIGVAHITAELVLLAKGYGFDVVVIDPRDFFTNRTEFDVAPDDIVTSYPSEVLHKYPLDVHTYAAILSHDPKIDDDALDVLLKTDIGYIGALGSKKNHAKRVGRLQERGFGPQEIDRIHAPIGLDIGAKGAKEIAFSIFAQIIQVKNGKA